jgi:hypothetical protein
MASLHQDLVDIRTKAGITPAQIQQKTKIPESIIREIEKGIIFESTEQQKTYVRSFTRSYAKAIGIKDDDIVKALDLNDSGEYVDFLASKYIQKAEKKKNTSDSSDQNNDLKIEVAPEPQFDASILKPGPTSTIGAEEYSRPDPSRAYNKATPPPPKIETVDWADVGQRFTGIRSGSAAYLGILVILILLIGGTYIVINWPESDDVETTTTIVDTPSENLIPAPIISPQTNDDDVIVVEQTPPPTSKATLPDTLFIVIKAINNKLEPVRVLSDVNNIRSPYWIETNQAMRFDFINQVEITGNYSRMALFVNGHYLQNFRDYIGSGNAIRITREILETYPNFFSNEPPVLPTGITAPTVIRDRPVF